MVEFIEPRNAFEFIGIVDKVNLEMSEKFQIWRYQITIIPVNKNWKNMHTWIPIGKTLRESKAIEGTAIAEYIHQLNSLGIDNETVTATMKNMIGKKFWFVKKRIGKMSNEVWFPERLENDVYGQERQ